MGKAVGMLACSLLVWISFLANFTEGATTCREDHAKWKDFGCVKKNPYCKIDELAHPGNPLPKSFGCKSCTEMAQHWRALRKQSQHWETTDFCHYRWETTTIDEAVRYREEYRGGRGNLFNVGCENNGANVGQCFVKRSDEDDGYTCSGFYYNGDDEYKSGPELKINNRNNEVHFHMNSGDLRPLTAKITRGPGERVKVKIGTPKANQEPYRTYFRLFNVCKIAVEESGKYEWKYTNKGVRRNNSKDFFDNKSLGLGGQTRSIPAFSNAKIYI